MLRIRLSYWPVLFLALWGCRKDVEDFRPYAPSAQELSALLEGQVPNASTNTAFVFNQLSEDKVLETPNGTKVFLIDNDHLFADQATGATVLCSTCPDLKIEVTEVLDKSDVIARGLNTVADGGILFESGGMVRVQASCNGQPLALLPDRTLKIQLPNNDPQNDFFVFNWNNPAVSTDMHWSMTNQEVFKAEWPAPNGVQLGYELLVKDLGWSACGRILTDTTSSFCVELPPGFGDQNTLAYLVFENQETVAPLQFDLGQNKFCFPKVPTGFQVQLLAVSKLGGQYWLGKAQTETGTNTTFQLGTQEMTEQAVLNFVKSL